MIRNTMWLSVGSVVAVGALADGTLNIVGLVAHEMETSVQTFAAQGITSIDVDNDAGAVTVEGADARSVVTTTASASTTSRERSNCTATTGPFGRAA